MKKDGVKFVPVVAKQVTVPLWKWIDNTPKHFSVLEPMRVGAAMKERATKDAPKGQMAPATLMRVRNLETEIIADIIVGELLKTALTENYPADKYVGKWFSSTQTVIEGKRYRGYSLDELEQPK